MASSRPASGARDLRRRPRIASTAAPSSSRTRRITARVVHRRQRIGRRARARCRRQRRRRGAARARLHRRAGEWRRRRALQRRADASRASRAIGAAHRRYGTTGFLPTLITDTREHMAEAVAATAARRSQRACPACSASISKGRSSTPSGRASTTRASCGRWRRRTSRSSPRSTAGRTLMTLAPEKVPAGDHRAPGRRRRDRLGRPHRGRLRDDRRGARGRADRLHPPLQRHAAARRPRARAGRRRARRPGHLVRPDRRPASTSPRRASASRIAAKGWERMMLVTDAMPSVGSDLADVRARTAGRSRARTAG